MTKGLARLEICICFAIQTSDRTVPRPSYASLLWPIFQYAPPRKLAPSNFIFVLRVLSRNSGQSSARRWKVGAVVFPAGRDAVEFAGKHHLVPILSRAFEFPFESEGDLMVFQLPFGQLVGSIKSKL